MVATEVDAESLSVEALRETVERQRKAIAGLMEEVQELRKVRRGSKMGGEQEKKKSRKRAKECLQHYRNPPSSGRGTSGRGRTSLGVPSPYGRASPLERFLFRTKVPLSCGGPLPVQKCLSLASCGDTFSIQKEVSLTEERPASGRW